MKEKRKGALRKRKDKGTVRKTIKIMMMEKKEARKGRICISSLFE